MTSNGVEMDKKKTILIVDIDEDLLNLYSQILKENNYNVFTADNDIEALELYKKNEIDLVLTEGYLPKEKGYELIKNLNHDTPIIIMTGFYNDELKDLEEEQDNIKEVLMKVFSPKDLIKTIDEYC